MELERSMAGILEHMFKHSEETCQKRVTAGGLDAVLYWCRPHGPGAPVTLRSGDNCARHRGQAAAAHGGEACRRVALPRRRLLQGGRDAAPARPAWPWAVLATNKEVEREVEHSGTLTSWSRSWPLWIPHFARMVGRQ